MPLATIPVAALDLADHIREDDLVTWGQAMGEPRALVDLYTAARHRIGPTRALLGLQLSDGIAEIHTDFISPVSYGALGSVRALARAGRLQLLPCRYSALPGLITTARFRPDIVLVQLSPPGPDGSHSLGWCSDILPVAMKHARAVIAEINPAVPWVRMDRPLDLNRIAVAIESRIPLPEFSAPLPGATEEAIADRLTPRIPDGATLQIGVGAIPSAILGGLRHHRDLGLHSGLVTDGIADLASCGALTNARKPLLPGIGVGAVVLGGDKVTRYVADNPGFMLCGADYTHGARALSALDNLVAINSALEVDLFGQVNAEQAGPHYVGAIGGQPDFMQAATAAPNGLSVIALPATAGRGEARRSRIVARIDRTVTTARYDVDIVVTEHGLADLRGLDLAARARALIATSAPEFRDALERAARMEGPPA